MSVASASLVDRFDQIARAMPRTSMLQIPDDNLDLFAKLEYENLFGSAKDRSCLGILEGAVRRGDLQPESTVVESSSGNFAISMASFCRFLSVPFVPVLDPNCNAKTLDHLGLLCERIEMVTERDDSGGFLKSRLERVSELRSELDDAYWSDQHGNRDAAAAHYRMTGAELCADLASIDYVFLGVSTGGTIAGVSRRVKEVFPRAVVVAVDVAGSVIFGGAPRPRYIPGLGSSLKSTMVEEALIDEVMVVGEKDIVRGCHELLAGHGIYAGGSTGAVYTAIQRYFADYRGPRPTVAFLCVDRGNAYADTIYNPDWSASLLAA